MCRATRTILRYDPIADLRARWAGWDIRVISGLDDDTAEVFLPARRTCLLSRALYSLDPHRLVAHVVAHLDLHRVHVGGQFTPAQEEEAELLAQMRLDREDQRRLHSEG